MTDTKDSVMPDIYQLFDEWFKLQDPILSSDPHMQVDLMQIYNEAARAFKAGFERSESYLQSRIAEAEKNGEDKQFEDDCNYLMDAMCDLIESMGRNIEDFDSDGTPMSIFHDVIIEFIKALKPLQIVYDDKTGSYGTALGNFYSRSAIKKAVAEAEERQRRETFDKTIDVLRNFKGFRRWHDEISDENVEYILSSILNAGGQDDE